MHSTIQKKKNKINMLTVFIKQASLLMFLLCLCNQVYALPIFALRGDSYMRRIDRFNQLSQEEPSIRNVEAMRNVLERMQTDALNDAQQQPEIIATLTQYGFAPGEQIDRLLRRVARREERFLNQHNPEHADNTLVAQVDTATRRQSARLLELLQGGTHVDAEQINHLMGGRAAAMPEALSHTLEPQSVTRALAGLEIAERARPVLPHHAPSMIQDEILEDFVVKEGMCGVCFVPSPLIHLVCEHAYCKECLEGVVNTAMRDRNTVNLTCPTPECRLPIDQIDIKRIIDGTDEASRAKLDQLAMIQVKECAMRQGFVYCPGVNCDYFFANDRREKLRHHCPLCDQYYCTLCRKDHAMELTCGQARAQAAQANTRARILQLIDELQAQIWQVQNSQACPGCHTMTEKNQGCNHMTCRTAAGGGCRREYCWGCLGAYNPGFGCNSGGCARPEARALVQRARDARLVELRARLRQAERALETGEPIENLPELVQPGVDNRSYIRALLDYGTDLKNAWKRRHGF